MYAIIEINDILLYIIILLKQIEKHQKSKLLLKPLFKNRKWLSL